MISSFFKEKGLVRQQLDSFNEFVSNSIQEIIDENPGASNGTIHPLSPIMEILIFAREALSHLLKGYCYPCMRSTKLRN